MPRRTTALAVAALLGVSLAAGCQAQESATSTTTAPGADTGAGSTPAADSTYPTVAAMAETLRSGGIACTLEYEGLRDDATSRELSICVVGDEQLYLSVWDSPADLEAFAASPEATGAPTAVGGNWSVSAGTSGTAGQIAVTLGGTLAGGAGGAGGGGG